jgi:hypothetical protein
MGDRPFPCSHTSSRSKPYLAVHARTGYLVRNEPQHYFGALDDSPALCSRHDAQTRSAVSTHVQLTTVTTTACGQFRASGLDSTTAPSTGCIHAWSGCVATVGSYAHGLRIKKSRPKICHLKALDGHSGEGLDRLQRVEELPRYSRLGQKG